MRTRSSMKKIAKNKQSKEIALPYDVWCKIFDYLNGGDLYRSLSVWPHFLSHPKYWETMTINGVENEATVRGILAAGGSHTHTIVFKDRDDLHKILHLIPKMNPNVQKIELFNCSGHVAKKYEIGVNAMLAIFKNCAHLKSVNLMKCECPFSANLQKLLSEKNWRVQMKRVWAPIFCHYGLINGTYDVDEIMFLKFDEPLCDEGSISPTTNKIITAEYLIPN